jgi:thiol-disulfide isomerase/thioredoxin
MNRTLRLSVLAVAVLACACSAGADDDGLRLELQDPARGTTVEVGAGAGVTHLVLFATWCPPCVAELERLRELEARYRDRGYDLVIVAVRTRQDTDRLARYVQDEAPPGRLLFDAAGQAEAALGGELPTHVLLDSAGREIARAGDLGPDVEAAVERALAGRRPGGARTP